MATGADDFYRGIIDQIEAAGFYVSGPRTYQEPNLTWDRIIPASKLRPEGGYTGNSFWVSYDDGEWYIGVWGGSLYQIHDSGMIAKMCIAWMTAKPDGTYYDFDSWLIEEFGLYEIDERDFRPTRLMESAEDEDV